jgi:hypothetical protein
MATPLHPPSTTEHILARLTAVELDLAVLKSTCATREDLANLALKTQASIGALEVKMVEMEARLIKWFVGTAVTLSAGVGTIAFTAAKFVH